MSFVVEASAARGGLDHTRPKLMAYMNASPTGMNNAQKDPIIAFAVPYFHHPARNAKYS
jgi:hypothetical protein